MGGGEHDIRQGGIITSLFRAQLNTSFLFPPSCIGNIPFPPLSSFTHILYPSPFSTSLCITLPCNLPFPALFLLPCSLPFPALSLLPCLSKMYSRSWKFLPCKVRGINMAGVPPFSPGNLGNFM